jgi:hypothetical protein
MEFQLPRPYDVRFLETFFLEDEFFTRNAYSRAIDSKSETPASRGTSARPSRNARHLRLLKAKSEAIDIQKAVLGNHRGHRGHRSRTPLAGGLFYLLSRWGNSSNRRELLTMSQPHDHCPALAFSLRVLGVPCGVVRLSHPLAVRLANYLAAFISLLCACMAFGGCEPPMTARVATPEEIRTFFENKKMKVLTFLGYSGAEYENKAMMLEQAARILNQFDPRTTIVNIGGHRRRHRFSLRGSETEGVPDFRHRVDSGERKQRRPIALR